MVNLARRSAAGNHHCEHCIRQDDPTTVRIMVYATIGYCSYSNLRPGMIQNSNDVKAKWRKYRWIPVLFVTSFSVSLIVLFIVTPAKLMPSSSMLTPLQPLLTLIPEEVKLNIVLALLIALLVSGGACLIYVLTKKFGD